jgi:glycerol-3-phosphate dehydrogenase (NAD(P)+)
MLHHRCAAPRKKVELKTPVMPEHASNIAFLGAGTIGTALGNTILENSRHAVTLYSIEEPVVRSINEGSKNTKYFPGIHLNAGLKASTDFSELQTADAIFLAVPSGVIMEHLESVKKFLPENAVLINLAKGFGPGRKTLVRSLAENYKNPVCSLKGPSFAKEIINHVPTAFTLAAKGKEEKQLISDIFEGTTVFLDYSDDLEGVEILSILKNIYAISMGIVDAHYNSPNIRFLFLTRAFNEMRKILLMFGGREETLFNYCGYGDFTLTALNDLSRNRTLGLLIGKGFFTKNVSHDLVLEGQVAVNVFYEELSGKTDIRAEFPIIAELYQIFHTEYNLSEFVNTVLHI